MGASIRRRTLLFLALAFVWGTAYVGIRAGLPYFPPILFAALRYEIGGLVLLAVVARRAERADLLPRTRVDAVQIALRAALVFAGFHIFLFLGQQHVPSAVAAIVVGTNPILTGGFASVLLPETGIRPRTVLGLALGLLGVGVLAEPSPAQLVPATAVGPVLILVGSASLALGSVLGDRRPMRADVLSVTAWSMFLGALLTHAVSLGVGESLAGVRWTATGVGALVFIALVPGALGFLIYFELLERAGSFETNLVSYVVPLVSAVLGWLVLGERLGPAAVAGFVLVLLGFLAIKWPTARRTLRRVGLV